jgi:hypothetical protein
MTPESRKSSLLGNGSLSTFPKQGTDLWENTTVSTKLTDVPAATDKHTITEKLLGVIFGPSRVEAGSNTSTVALRDVGGDKKGNIESEIPKYGRETHGTRTRE